MQVVPKPGFIAEYFPEASLGKLRKLRKLNCRFTFGRTRNSGEGRPLFAILVAQPCGTLQAYEDRAIPGGIDPDIVRTEKQLDFEEAGSDHCLSLVPQERFCAARWRVSGKAFRSVMPGLSQPASQRPPQHHGHSHGRC